MHPATPLVRPFLPVLTTVAARWISQERGRHRPNALPLDTTQRNLLEGAFEPETLDAVRVLRVDRLENPVMPDFVSNLVGQTSILDMRKAGGVTYGDTVLINTTFSPGVTPIRLLFHEVVHVAQYRQLGLVGFAESYVGGWIDAGFTYRKIPLEEQAYALEALFAKGELGEQTIDARLRGEASTTL